jgi:hypothetical protein
LELQKQTKCAKQWFDSQAYKHKMYDENLCDATEEEMKAFFALHIIMSLVKNLQWKQTGQRGVLYKLPCLLKQGHLFDYY